MIRASNSPLFGEAGCLLKRSVLSSHHRMTRARLHDRPAQLRVRPVFAQLRYNLTANLRATAALARLEQLQLRRES
jgi:hypothetical protein